MIQKKNLKKRRKNMKPLGIAYVEMICPLLQL